MNPIIVVSRISSVLKPSTPRKYSAPIDGIHGSALHELELGALRVVPEPQRHRDDEADEGGDVRDPADGVLVLLVDEQQQERAGQRREQDEREVMIHKTS